jgi:hypothetical protein
MGIQTLGSLETVNHRFLYAGPEVKTIWEDGRLVEGIYGSFKFLEDLSEAGAAKKQPNCRPGFSPSLGLKLRLILNIDERIHQCFGGSILPEVR